MGAAGEGVYYSLLKKLIDKKSKIDNDVFKSKVLWREENITVSLDKLLSLAKVSDNIENYKIKFIQKQIITKLSEYRRNLDDSNTLEIENQVYNQVAEIIENYKGEVLENGNSRKKRLELLKCEIITQKDLYIKGVEGILNDSQNEILNNIHKNTETLIGTEGVENRQKYFENELLNTEKLVSDLNELSVRIIDPLHSYCKESILCKDDVVASKDELDEGIINLTEDERNNIIKMKDKLELKISGKNNKADEIVNKSFITAEEINSLFVLDNILSDLHEGKSSQEISIIKLVTKKAKLPMIKEKIKVSVREAIKVIYKNLIDKIIKEIEDSEIKYIVEIERQYCLQYGNVNTVNEQIDCMDFILNICKKDLKTLSVKELISNNIIV